MKKINISTVLISLIILSFVPDKVFALSLAETKFTYSKLGFSATPNDINKTEYLSYDTLIDNMIDNINEKALTKEPEWLNEEFDIKKDKSKVLELKIWWYKEMITTNSPFTERMTLFWHNLFTSSISKVKSPILMYQQNVLLRKYALGNFKEFLHAIARDPAMMIYLDNRLNKKGKPNENFARELLELFTLGEGNYTEDDIKDAARALTGWSLDKKTGLVKFNEKQHDKTLKEFMGQKGRFNLDDILEIILANKRTSIYITERLWKEFISDTPNKDEVEAFSEIFRSNNYELKPLLKALLKSKSFRNSNNIANKIKSPVELIVGTIRLFNIPLEEKNYTQLVKYAAKLGQDLFNPPNVKGWKGGNDWITSDSLLIRRQFLQRVMSGSEIFSKEYQNRNNESLPNKEIIALWVNNEFKPEELLNMVLPTTPVKNIDKTLNKVSFIRAMVLDPVYQLK